LEKVKKGYKNFGIIRQICVIPACRQAGANFFILTFCISCSIIRIIARIEFVPTNFYFLNSLPIS